MTLGVEANLGLPLRLEPLHLPLSWSHRKVGVLSAIVVSQPSRFVAMFATEFAHCRLVRGKAWNSITPEDDDGGEEGVCHVVCGELVVASGDAGASRSACTRGVRRGC